MRKIVISMTFCFALILSVLPSAALAADNLSNFTKVKSYHAGQFTDVSTEWFAQDVQAAYEYGLISGTSATTFSPSKTLTIAEALKLADCLHSIYTTGSQNFTAGTPWYQPYADYALANGIIASPYPDYTVNATRADFAVIFASALPDEALTAINAIDDNKIPDVTLSYPYGPAVYKLYRAGILTGSDSAGSFSPASTMTRDAVAAIVTRIAIPSFRKTFSLSSQALTVTAAQEKIAVTIGVQVTVDFTGSSDAFTSITFSGEDASVISCAWGKWTGNTIPLTITGLSAGSTSLLIELLDDKDNSLASTTISVTVKSAASASIYYLGYSPTPDFGTYTDTGLFYSWFDPQTGGTSYYYKSDDIQMSLSEYFPGYVVLLKNNGFTFLGTFVDDHGQTLSRYLNTTANWKVIFGKCVYSGINCIQILVLPGK